MPVSPLHLLISKRLASQVERHFQTVLCLPRPIPLERKYLIPKTNNKALQLAPDN